MISSFFLWYVFIIINTGQSLGSSFLYHSSYNDKCNIHRNQRQRREQQFLSLRSPPTSSLPTSSLLSSNSNSIPMNTPARESLPDHLRLVPIEGKGLGVITTTPIPRNTVVGDYKGEILTVDEKDRRYLNSLSHLRTQMDLQWMQSRIDRHQTITGNYLYRVSIPSSASSDQRSHKSIQPTWGGVVYTSNNENVDTKAIYIDAEDEYASLWTRFLNHGKPPLFSNLNPKSIHESYDGKPRVWFVTNRDIEAGEELCFDYGDDYWLPEDNVIL